MATELVHFDTAKRELALASSIDEVKLIRDKAEALRQYIKQQGASLEIQNQAAEIKIRAERRAWEMLTNPANVRQPGQRDEILHDAIFAPPKLSDLGIEPTTSHRWQLEASVPEEKFEGWLAQVKSANEELTSAGLRRLALQVKHQDVLQRVPELPPGKYQALYADPPWRYDNSGLGGSAENHYPTMTIEEMSCLNVVKLAGDDAVLFLWVTSPFLQEGLQLCQAWGFEYKTTFVWIKDRPTYGKLGFYNYGQHEFLFVATRGSCLPQHGTLEPSVLFAPKTKHSEKPEAVYELIEQMYSGPYIELFARKTRPNWAAWGTL